LFLAAYNSNASLKAEIKYCKLAGRPRRPLTVSL
jgi:hypothetical protein